MQFKIIHPPFVLPDDETDAAAGVEASSVLLVPWLFGPKNRRRSCFALRRTSPKLTIVNKQTEI